MGLHHPAPTESCCPRDSPAQCQGAPGLGGRGPWVSLQQGMCLGEPSAGGGSAVLLWPFPSCMDAPACHPQGIHPHRAALPAAQKLLEGQPGSHCPPQPTLPWLVLLWGLGVLGPFPWV